MIHTGPQSQEREGHLAARDRPAHDRFDIMAVTFWAGHSSPPCQGKLRGKYAFVTQKAIPPFVGVGVELAYLKGRTGQARGASATPPWGAGESTAL